MPFEKRLISDNGLTAEAGGFGVDIRLPWYRSLPLSVVELKLLKLDGEAVPAERVSLELNGKRFALKDLADRPDEWWYVQDSAWLHVDQPGLAAGSEHEVEVTLAVYPPYIHGFAFMTNCTKRLRAH